MQRFPRNCLLVTAVLALTLMAVSISQRVGNRKNSQRSFEDWDVLELVDHLNQTGLEVRLRSSAENGVIDQRAFLTVLDKNWEELNHLRRDPHLFQEWRGVVSCERVGRYSKPMLQPWDDHYLIAGPFVFFGDAELLERIRVILVPPAPTAAP